MERNRLLTAFIWMLLWLGGNLWWLFQDRLIRDGDEEGHVGAAELFVQIITEQGWLHWFLEAWQGNYGEYPPLFAASLGAWWSMWGGPPSELIIRSFGLICILLCALSVAWLCHLQKGPWSFAFVVLLLSPLLNGIGRHFMIEIFVVLWTAMFAAILWLAIEKKRVGYTLLAGLVFGLGLLSKQSFLIAVLPLFFLIPRLGKRSWAFVLATLITAGPWYVQRMVDQEQYLSQSVQANISTSWYFHLFDPIANISWSLLGPWAMFLLMIALVKGEKKEYFWWLLGALVLFVVLPKKYPRLLLALLPSAVLLLSMYYKDVSLRKQQFLLFPMAIWLVVVSSVSLPATPFPSKVDDRCAQVWIRAPDGRDFGLRKIADAIQKAPTGAIAVDNSPSIPCSIQTTHEWSYHLEPYLRRRGIEREVMKIDPTDSRWVQAAMRIRWIDSIEMEPLPMILEISDSKVP